MLRDRWIFGRATGIFTLQWHLTNACDFHCRHCYDRSHREELDWSRALGVLADFRSFCRMHRVQPRISLTGGDPLKCSYFWPLYKEIAGAGIGVSLLGNPAAVETIESLKNIQAPLYYQVSLEGLQSLNDRIRGAGHFEMTLEFLKNARQAKLKTHVMLTLTDENLDDVIPLGELLKDKTGRFTFNRLSQVGTGASLALPSMERYVAFLRNYIAAHRNNPTLGFKDNLFNIVRHHFGRPLFPGCTGFGCGAAFNFVALLPDGEVHACRKWPSPIGNVASSSFNDIYFSAKAKAIRRGSAACRTCKLKKSCGGCPAVVFGRGLDPAKDRDPHCFLERRQELLAGF